LALIKQIQSTKTRSQASHIESTIKNRVTISKVIKEVNAMYLQAGKWSLAMESYQKSLATLDWLGDLSDSASTLSNMGLIHLQVSIL
jgi:hypothetical protein